MNMHDLIMNTDERGRVGFRGAFSPLHSLTESETAVARGLGSGLIHLIAAWRSTEDRADAETRGTGPIDRRVYGLTNKGWAYKITGGTDHLQNYLVSVMADAELAHWGATDASSGGLRFPESEFDRWENPLLVGSYDGPDWTPPHLHYGDDLDWPLPPYPYPQPFNIIPSAVWATVLLLIAAGLVWWLS